MACQFMNFVADCSVKLYGNASVAINGIVNACNRPVDVTLTLQTNEHGSQSWLHTFINNDESQPISPLYPDTVLHFKQTAFTENTMNLYAYFVQSGIPLEPFINQNVSELHCSQAEPNAEALIPLLIFIVLIILIFITSALIIYHVKRLRASQNSELLENMETMGSCHSPSISSNSNSAMSSSCVQNPHMAFTNTHCPGNQTKNKLKHESRSCDNCASQISNGVSLKRDVLINNAVFDSSVDQDETSAKKHLSEDVPGISNSLELNSDQKNSLKTSALPSDSSCHLESCNNGRKRQHRQENGKITRSEPKRKQSRRHQRYLQDVRIVSIREEPEEDSLQTGFWSGSMIPCNQSEVIAA